MRMPKRGEKGFTLIELLIVVAILGVLAAVVIPNVGRFIGRGKTEAISTELSNVQAAVLAMMVDNNLSTIPNPVSGNTSDMNAFPDTSSDWSANHDKDSDPDGIDYTTGDNKGYVLYQHDVSADSSNSTLVNYLASRYTKGTYSVDSTGTVTQVTTGY